MSRFPEGNALVYCEGAFNTPNGKTAHGLVRRTARYNVLAVVDSRYDGQDSGQVLDGRPNGIPVVGDLLAGLQHAADKGLSCTHLVVGLAPDGGRMPPSMRKDVGQAIRAGLNVDSGLHDFLTEDEELVELAGRHGVTLRDVRKPPDRKDLHFFDGKIEQVQSFRVALLGTDSAVGKRTTAWLLVDELQEAGYDTELIGTGQTAWMQGARFGILLESLINDFLTGEIEHVIWRAWEEARPEIMVLEGQGSLLNPAYPGGYELIAAGRPHAIILQHAPARKDYDGFPGYPIQDMAVQIQAAEIISGKPVVAIAVNHEDMTPEETDRVCAELEARHRIAVCAPLLHGVEPLVEALQGHLNRQVRLHE